MIQLRLVFLFLLLLAATTSTKVLPIAYKGCNKESLLVMAPQVKTQVGARHGGASKTGRWWVCYPAN